MEQKKNPLVKWMAKKKKILIAVIVIILVIIAVCLGVGKYADIHTTPTKLGFEDIGELATQSAYCREIDTIDEGRDLFGVRIPFTESKCIYSYGVEIKAGYDFGEIKWSVNEASKVIKITLPEVKILSAEIDDESFEVYYEKESAFKNISITDMNEAQKELKKDAKQTAEDNGLYEKARENAETIIRGFVGQVYNLDEYEVKFAD